MPVHFGKVRGTRPYKRPPPTPPLLLFLSPHSSQPSRPPSLRSPHET
ncbi:hypothetical protein VN97_g4534, partial [Penicillium thymicola]